MCLGATRILLILPFKYIAPRLGQQTVDLPDDPNQSNPPEWAWRIAWAIEKAAQHTPWESACLVQAITGKYLLKRRGLRTRLFLGMRKDQTGKFLAHAWLKAGSKLLIGANGHETFTVLSVFSEN